MLKLLAVNDVLYSLDIPIILTVQERGHTNVDSVALDQIKLREAQVTEVWIHL